MALTYIVTNFPGFQTLCRKKNLNYAQWKAPPQILTTSCWFSPQKHEKIATCLPRNLLGLALRIYVKTTIWVEREFSEWRQFSGHVCRKRNRWCVSNRTVTGKNAVELRTLGVLSFQSRFEMSRPNISQCCCPYSAEICSIAHWNSTATPSLVHRKLFIGQDWYFREQFQLFSEQFIAANELQKGQNGQSIIGRNNFNAVTGMDPLFEWQYRTMIFWVPNRKPKWKWATEVRGGKQH